MSQELDRLLARAWINGINTVDILKGHSSPGNLQEEQVVSKEARQIPHTSSGGTSHVQIATPCHFLMFTFICVSVVMFTFHSNFSKAHLEALNFTRTSPNTRQTHMSIVIPGDSIAVDSSALGPGIYAKHGSVILVHAGILQSSSKSVHVESNGRRYIPSTNDYVIGMVTGSFGDSFRVALSNFTFPVSLSTMAFPNASKKNRPNLKTGGLVYARVSNASPDVDVEIECMDPTTGKDGGFGPLEGGYVVDVSLAFARVLLFDSQHPLLNLLVKKCKFEIAIGLNGKVWINTEDMKHTLSAANAIVKCQNVPSSEFATVINEEFK